MKPVLKWNARKVFKRLSFLMAWVLALTMVLPPGTPAALTSSRGTQLPAWEAWPSAPTEEYTLYLPLVTRNLIPSPGDDLIVTWAEAVEGSTRTVLLQWNPLDETAQAASATAGARYTISRRVAGTSTWQLLGEVQAAANAGAMVALLGPDLTTQLSWDLRDDPADPALTEGELYARLFNDPHEAHLLATQFYEVALVLGEAYLDHSAPLGVDLEYQVGKVGGSSRGYVPARVPATPASPSTPTNLREAWDGPESLGWRPSDRPADADERYHWTLTQQYRAWDGNIYLMWDLPTQPDGATVRDGAQALNLRGYLVYRAAPGSQTWELVNQQKDNCHVTPLTPGRASACTLMVGAGALPMERDGGPDYYFREDLHAVYTDTAQIYTGWRYKVCPVDALRVVGTCSTPATITGRELLPPAPVREVAVTITEQPPRVHLTWVYSDSTELSAPLRFYVTRSPTFTASLDTWEPVYPAGSTNPYIETASTTPLTMTIVDKPPVDVPYWYRVQVRDNAGNWSQPSAPVMGAVHTRTAPDFTQPPYDPVDCANNAMPLNLTGLDPAIQQIVVYRAFADTGPWQIIQRVPVSAGAAVIADAYTPPYPVDAYYKLEAVDGHGNVSVAVSYCAELDTTLPPPPPVVTTTVQCSDNVCDWTVELEDPDSAYPDPGGPTVVVGLPGEEGTVVVTETLSGGSAEGNLNWGAWYTVTAYYDSDVPGTTVMGRNVNNFLDTDRQLTDLGALYKVQWLTDTVSGEHYVRIAIAPIDEVSVPVAAFRRIPGGNWMQVTSIGAVQPHHLEDRSDPSPMQTYEYTVLAFSPHTYEVLGAWEPETLPALFADMQPLLLDSAITSAPTLPSRCEYNRYAAAALGMPASINLYNGWTIQNVYYYRSDTHDLDCPMDIYSFRPDHAYGDGRLTNGSLTWSVGFYDIDVNATTGDHEGGRIVGNLNQPVGGSTIFTATLGQIEFLPTSAIAEVTVTLPPMVKAYRADTGERSRRIFGQFPNVTPELHYGSHTLPADWYLVDENLPWQLRCDAAVLGYNSIRFDATLETLDRLSYTPPDPSGFFAHPDNNLGYLRASYTDPTATIRPDGLWGTFTTSDTLHYSTGQPAAFIIHATGAHVRLEASQITGGYLAEAGAYLDYRPLGTYTDYIVADRDCLGNPRDRYTLCTGFWGNIGASRRLTLAPMALGRLPIYEEGRIVAGVTLDQIPTWIGFGAQLTDATLYIAGASFPDAPSSWGPMPAENAWRQLPEQGTGGDLDPGLNLNAVSERSYYYCYSPADFEDSNFDLYVRRGGVSEFVGIYETVGALERANAYGYRERLFNFEGTFIDNGMIPPPASFQTELSLPYPTDAGFPLAVTAVNPVSNCPAGGALSDPVETLHKYWDFVETPSLWGYTPTHSDYGMALGEQDWLFGLHGTAVINGLHRQSAVDPDLPVTMNVYSEWLPDGDVGDVRAMTSTLAYQVSGLYFVFSNVELSRYYSTPTNPASLPSTLGIDLSDNFSELSPELLDGSGNLTPQSLKACSANDAVGCGFVVVDGNAAVEYFGEPHRADAVTLNALDLPIDLPKGQFPLANNDLLTMTVQLLTDPTALPWVWPIVNELVDVDLPVKFLGSTQGAVIAAVQPDTTFFPGMEVFHGDIGAVVTVAWDDTAGFENEFGIYLGYPASQAAFRALAMNRPEWLGGVQPYDHWEDVEADVREWAFEKFDFTEGPGADDDAADLAALLWDDWCANWSGETCLAPLDFSHAYDVTMPVVQSLDAEAYGVAGLTSGPALADAHANLSFGAAEVIFRLAGLDVQVESLQGGAYLRFDAYQYEDLYIDVFLEADWVAVELNRDRELTFSGDTYLNLIDDWGTDGYLYGLATVSGLDEWRVEGSLDLDTIGLSGFAGIDVSGVFGVGTISGYPISYVGIMADLYFMDYGVGATVLVGSFDKTSPILRDAGYGDALDVLGAQNLYSGWYVNAYGEIPVGENDSCMLKANAGVGVRIWYFLGVNGTGVYGGDLSGWVYGQVGCVLSARGNLTLGYAHLDYGGEQYSRRCNDTECDVYGGNFWVAIGIGWCDPKSWRSWGSRWWGDSWCYTFGAYVDLSYLTPPGGWDGWDYNLDLDFE